jgi:antitoxin component of MazEF toxin-antitoxin module
MIKTLTPIGNSLGIVIERPILELLEIDRDTQLEVRTDGESLIIRPIRETPRARARVQKSAKRVLTWHTPPPGKGGKSG